LLRITLLLGFLAIFSAPGLAQDGLSSLAEVDKRGAWQESREGRDEHGGFLVIWYDRRHEWDAEGMLHNLKSSGMEHVVALPGRTDGQFQLLAGGKINRYLFSLEEARDGTLLGEAQIWAGQRGIK